MFIRKCKVEQFSPGLKQSAACHTQPKAFYVSKKAAAAACASLLAFAPYEIVGFTKYGAIVERLCPNVCCCSINSCDDEFYPCSRFVFPIFLETLDISALLFLEVQQQSKTERIQHRRIKRIRTNRVPLARDNTFYSNHYNLQCKYKLINFVTVLRTPNTQTRGTYRNKKVISRANV